MENLGIVVVGRNEGERLRGCFSSLLKHSYPIVYVDSMSNDGSVEYAKSIDVDVVLLDNSKPLNASRARNSGFEFLYRNNPQLQYIHFIDGDCEIDRKWPEYVIELLERNSKYAVVFGILDEKYRNSNIYTRLCDIEWKKNTGEQKNVGGLGIATIRVEAFKEAGGFDESLIAGADPELYLRIRKNKWIVYCADVNMGLHDCAMYQFKQWWMRCMKSGYAYMDGTKWGGYHLQKRSTLIWGVLIPTLIIALSIKISLVILLCFAIYPIQVMRTYHKVNISNVSRNDKLLYAAACILAKFPQTLGMGKWIINKIFQQQPKIIEYKAPN